MAYAATICALMATGVVLSVVRADIGDINNHAAKPNRKPFLDNKAICTSPQCVLTAAGIINDMDSQTDPCQDFSQFTCGGFNDKHEIPAEKSSVGYFGMIHDENSRVIRSIVDVSLGKGPKAAPGDVAAQNNIKKIQDLFASCMDEAAILKAGRKPVADEVQKVLKSFPAGGTGLEKTALSRTMGQLLKSGIGSFVGLYVGADSTNPLVNVLQLYEGGLGLPSKEYYKEQEVVQLYQGTVAQMLQIILGYEDVANRTEPPTLKDVKPEWSDAAKDVVDFETQLAGIATEKTELGDPLKSNNPRTAEQLSALNPSIDWPLLIQEILPADVQNTRPIIVSSLPYLTKLDTLLKKTSTKTLQHYFSWIVTKNLAGNMARPYKQPLIVLNAALSGTSADVKVDRWKTCVGVVNANLGDIAGHYFVQQRFGGNSRTTVMSIIDALQSTYARTFPTLQWLDKNTRDGALDKLKAIVQLVGYSTNSPDVAFSKSLETYFKGYNVDPSNFFANQIQYSTWSKAESLATLNKPVNRKKLDYVPQTVNAFYDPSSNRILFPAGILQVPYFNVDNPEYVNYGGMGVVAGHEITHGFDNMGHHYDSVGRIHNWWTNATEQAFNEKAQCFVEQYGNFTVKGPDGKDYNVNGQLTLGENIADNGGLKQAFRAWQFRHKSDVAGKKYKNFRLPGLENYTPEQLFFISYGRLWCNKQRPEAAVQQIRGDSHSPAKWRINGAVQNSPEFAQAFKCKTDTPMNPTKKCELW
ncbi:hypothetical protein BGX23_012578 [Mortierella sp. AD031]|nr:hypothetical protein BGX23_012578 [Mortierella sp. AD031]